MISCISGTTSSIQLEFYVCCPAVGCCPCAVDLPRRRQFFFVDRALDDSTRGVPLALVDVFGNDNLGTWADERTSEWLASSCDLTHLATLGHLQISGLLRRLQCTMGGNRNARF